MDIHVEMMSSLMSHGAVLLAVEDIDANGNPTGRGPDTLIAGLMADRSAIAFHGLNPPVRVHRVRSYAKDGDEWIINLASSETFRLVVSPVWTPDQTDEAAALSLAERAKLALELKEAFVAAHQ